MRVVANAEKGGIDVLITNLLNLNSIMSRFALNHDAASSLFTVPVTIGSPAQPSNFLLDLSGQLTYALSWNTRTGMTRADKFYKIHDSTEGRYMNMAALSEDQVMGFSTES